MSYLTILIEKGIEVGRMIIKLAVIVDLGRLVITPCLILIACDDWVTGLKMRYLTATLPPI